MNQLKLSENELLEIRNTIVLERGISPLKRIGFQESPFSTAWFGKDDSGDYSYELCRLSDSSLLQIVFAYVIKGERWIQFFLNVFQLEPELKSLEELQGVDGLQYHLPPNSLTKMRLKVDDIKGIPLFSYDFIFGGHKLKSFNSENGLKRRVRQLGDLIEKDLSNIDSFIHRWNELHQVNKVDWQGNRLQ